MQRLLLTLVLAFQFLGLIRESYWCAFLGGVIIDLLIGTPLGFSSLILLLISGAVGLIRRFAEGSFPLLLLITLVVSVIFRVTQTFPTFNLSALLRDGFLDVGVMMAVYSLLKYFLKNLFGRDDLIIKT